jgi:mRNA interferase YafQ
MYKLKYTKSFEKDFSLCKKRGYDMTALLTVFKLLEEKGTLPATYKSHKLEGNYKNRWECHIKPDWLLIWDKDRTNLTMILLRTGTHSDLFKK